jgi:DNA modification methylase
VPGPKRKNSKQDIRRGRLSTDGLKAGLHAESKRRREHFADARPLPAPGRNDLLPNLELIEIPISDLKPPSRKVRRAARSHIEEVKQSITSFGVVDPPIATEDGRVLDGWIRVEAARELGLPTIRVIIVDHLSEMEARKLRLALNRLQERGEWDLDELRVEFQELIVLDPELSIPGFEAAEIDQLLLDPTEEASSEADTLPIDVPNYGSQPGDLWQLGDHLLLHGDARDPASYERLFADGRPARLVLTDVPFNVKVVGHITKNAGHREFSMAAGEMNRPEFEAFNLAWMDPAQAHLVDGGLLATFIDWRSVELILSCGRQLGLELLNLVVWAKTNGGQGSLWRSQHELVPFFKKGAAAHVNNVELGRHGRWRSNVWSYAGASSLGSDARRGLKQHPTVKPTALLEDGLLDVSHRGEIVVDPFVGSGSTLIAAERTGRHCRAIEIDGAYCGVTIARWQELTGRSAVLASTGQTFDELAAERAPPRLLLPPPEDRSSP